MQDVSKRGNPPAPIEGTNQNFFLPGEEGGRDCRSGGEGGRALIWGHLGRAGTYRLSRLTRGSVTRADVKNLYLAAIERCDG